MDAVLLGLKALWKPVTGLLLAGAVAAGFHFRVANVEADVEKLVVSDSVQTATYSRTVQLLVPIARYMCITENGDTELLQAAGLPCDELLRGVEIPVVVP